MRLLNVFAALSGVVALVMLVLAAHALQPAPEDLDRIQLAAFIQLGAAAAGLALANRSGVLNLVAGIMILAGAAIFGGILYTLAITHSRALIMLAPVGGITLILGWVVLVFAKPSA
ncbi:MAG: DUF423 domain-containing protein [Caulobacteraceae bacterium]|nr:DUF423 domain-containing protein [Caulobacteraceae bacterium]